MASYLIEDKRQWSLVMRVFVGSVMLYGAEIWAMTGKLRQLKNLRQKNA